MRQLLVITRLAGLNLLTLKASGDEKSAIAMRLSMLLWLLFKFLLT